jgi:NRPS condensation-like uncharacterized protein
VTFNNFIGKLAKDGINAHKNVVSEMSSSEPPHGGQRNSTDAAPEMLPQPIRATLLDRSMSLVGNVTDATLHGLVELEGRVDEERLARALRLLVDAEPVLGCRFVTTGGRPRFERRADLDSLALCTVQHVVPEGAAQGAQLARAVDSTTDPLVSVTLLRGERDVLWLRLSHLAGDGAGARDCLYRLAALTRALREDPDYRPAPNLYGRRGLAQIMGAQGIWERYRMVRRGLRDLRRRWYPRAWWRLTTTPGVAGAAAGGRTYLWHHLGARQLAAMRAYAGQRRATLNDLLVAAYLRGLARMIRPASHVPMRLRFTVDLRRYRAGGQAEAVCNLSTFGFLNAGPGPDRTFEELLARVSADMRALKADFLGLGEPALLGPLAAAVPHAWMDRAVRAQEGRSPVPELLTPTLTNFGALEPHRLAVDGLAARSAFLLPPVMYPPGFAIAASGFADSITLSAGFCESALSRQRVARLFARMAAELPGGSD